VLLRNGGLGPPCVMQEGTVNMWQHTIAFAEV
jgi:hypothetical protein